MGDTLHIAAGIRIERPVDQVRAQYRDIDHHIRNNVHPGIRYRWEPGAPGERKIRTDFRILGVPQYDVSVLEDRADGAFLIRYLEGSNAGMLLVHEFLPAGEGATDVRLSADAPVTLGRKLLGPLFVAGARQVMKKALVEDKRDLEGGHFTPGAAAGDVERALAPVASVRAAAPAAKRAVLEAACLVSAADGTVDPAERDAVVRLAALLDAASDAGWAMSRQAELADVAKSERIAADADRIGAALKAADVAGAGVVAAATVGLASEGLSLGELALLRRLAAAAGVAEDALGPIVDAADAALGPGPR